MNDLSLNLSRTFKCDAKTLWKGIENGAFLKFTGPTPDGFEMNFVEGGSYKITFGSCPAAVSGVFKQIVPHKKLVFSWDKVLENGQTDGYKTTVEIDLFEFDGATTMRLVHAGFETYELVEDHTRGWDSSMKDFLFSLREIFINKQKEKGDLYQRLNYKVNAPVEKVFQAVQKSEYLSQYFGTNSTDNFEEGNIVTWKFDGFGDFELHTRKVIENELIRFFWGNMHVSFNFRKLENDITDVRLEFTCPNDGQSSIDNFTSENEGWAMFIFRLKMFVEKGFTLKDY